MRIGVPRRGLAVLLVLAASSVLAGRTTQMLSVSATVSPSAVVGFEMSAQPLEITSKDLERGYVEVVMKSRMHLSTGRRNAGRPSIIMDMEPRADVFRSVSMASSAPSANGNGHSSAQQLLPSGEVSEFRYRFEFSKAAHEGLYANAISVTVEL